MFRAATDRFKDSLTRFRVQVPGFTVGKLKVQTHVRSVLTRQRSRFFFALRFMIDFFVQEAPIFVLAFVLHVSKLAILRFLFIGLCTIG